MADDDFPEIPEGRGIPTVDLETYEFAAPVQGALNASIIQGAARPNRVACDMPAGFSWDEDYALTPYLTVSGNERYGDIDKTPAELFGEHSTALSAPTNTFWVDVAAGSDSNNGLTAATAFQSLLAARNAVNALGSTAKARVNVKAGVYGIGYTWSGSTATAVGVNRDTAYVAYGGKVTVGSFLTDYTGFAADATHTNTFSMTALADPATRVVDLWQGGVEYTLVPSAAACNTTPGSWCTEGGKVYVNTANRLIPTAKTIRVFVQRPAFYARTAVNLFIGSEDGSPWSIQGGNAGGAWSNGGAVWVDMLTPIATKKVFVLDNVSADYSGAQGVTANGLTFERWYGLIAMFDCASVGPSKDAINVANNVYTTDGTSSPGTYVLTVNCTLTNPGRGNNVSCNSETAHSSNVHWIDIASRCSRGRGGTIRHVDYSEALIIGALVSGDIGDVHTATGTTQPTAVRADDSAELWLDKCVIDQQGGGYAIYTGGAAAAVHYRESIIRGAIAGVGTVDTY